jgi:hypothetical protein
MSFMFAVYVFCAVFCFCFLIGGKGRLGRSHQTGLYTLDP